jgi:hypothetical protein
MADKHLASTEIRKGEVVGEKQVATVVPDVKETRIKEGEPVNKSDFTDEEWADLVAAGAVTDDPSVLVRPENYKASAVQARAHADQVGSRGNELPEPSDDTNAENAQSSDDTNAQANDTARQVAEAEREFDEKLRTDPKFKASLLEGFTDQPRQHQAVIHAARQDFIANKVYGDDPRAVPGRKAVKEATAKNREKIDESGADTKGGN